MLVEVDALLKLLGGDLRRDDLLDTGQDVGEAVGHVVDDYAL